MSPLLFVFSGDFRFNSISVWCEYVNLFGIIMWDSFLSQQVG